MPNPLDAFKFLFDTLVYYPQLNLLQFFFKFTNDIGFAIILVAIVVNLLLWKVISGSFISGVKMRILGPQMKLIQDQYKTSKDDAPDVIMTKSTATRKAIGQLYAKHGIKTGSFFWVLFFQLFFASGVFYVVNNVANSIKDSTTIKGIYENIFGFSDTVFPSNGLNNLIKIDAPSTNYLWLPVLSLILSYLYGRYTFHWAPNLKIINQLVNKNTPPKDPKDLKKDEVPGIDPAALQRNQEFMVIYIIPVITFFINSSFSAGLNLYFVTLSLFNLIRQIIISNYYATHVDKMLQDVADSDPTSSDGNPLNNIDSPVDVALVASNLPTTSIELPTKSPVTIIDKSIETKTTKTNSKVSKKNWKKNTNKKR